MIASSTHSDGIQSHQQCILCFSRYNFRDENSVDVSKLYKLCCKYLHSALTTENCKKIQFEYGKGKKIPFCPECLKSAVELSDLKEKMKSFQKSVCELILMFSFGILHRQENVAIVEENKENYIKDKFVRFNLSLFPECESWVLPTTQPNKNKSVIYEDDPLDNLETPVQTSNIHRIEIGDVNEIELDTMKIEVLPNEEIRLESIIEKHLENYSSETFLDSKMCNTSNNTLGRGNCINVKRTPVIILDRLPINSRKKIAPRPEMISKSFITDPEINLNQNCSGGPVPSEIKMEAQKGESFSNYGQMFGSTSLDDPYAAPKTVSFQSTILPTTGEQLQPIDHNILSLQNATSTNPLLNLDNTLNNVLNKNQWPSSSSNKILSNKSLKLRRKGIEGGHEPESVKCQFCERMYPTKRSLLDHIKQVHRKVKKFQCTECDKNFAWKQVLTRHMITHTGEKPFKCAFCDKRFGLQSTLTDHNRIHTGKAVPCSICHKKFNSRANLHRHTKTNHPDKHNVQRRSKFSYKSSGILENQPMHISKYNFKCRECEEKYQTKADAIQHYHTIHFALDFSDGCILTTNDNY